MWILWLLWFFTERTLWDQIWEIWAVASDMDRLGLTIVIYLLSSVRRISVSSRRNGRVGPLHSLQSSSRKMAACWLLLKWFLWIWLWFLSVLLDRTFQEEPFIFENKLYSVYYYLTHHYHLLGCCAWCESGGKGFFSVGISWRKGRIQNKSGRWRVSVDRRLSDLCPRAHVDKSLGEWELAWSQEWVTLSDSELCAPWTGTSSS